MAKPDWGALQHQFLAEHAKSGISPKDWCEAQGLNYASARRYIKKPSAQTAQKSAQKKLRTAQGKKNNSSAQSNKHFDAAQEAGLLDLQSIDPRNYGLNDMQWKFVNEYLVDMDKTAAYKRAGYKCEGETAAAAARRLYRNVSVNAAIRDALDLRAKRTAITQDAVLQWWWDIATADATQLTEHHRACCRYCWGFGHHYQWRDVVEFDERKELARTKKQREPADAGGYGFDETLDPNPDCPRCNGAGISRPVFHDTRDLTGAARRLFAGVKEGKFGLEMITRNQDEAMKLVAQHLGMLKNKTELSGPDGAPVQTETVNLTPQEAAEAYKKLMG
ncbi:terminase small subunit [Raoultella ornithinolytica]|uniref:terminase small subunit n=1 Tax=Raoultella ornithinolytica TaxID=54291 RepID=UPI0028DE4586|nr:terminase small subunit [Raoultella ornithinolytica]ELM7284724.1 terminase small subunit [Raoultella ornithinolytica]ELO0970680.1 terminase small subunit [Raoultella ornithinolytica]